MLAGVHLGGYGSDTGENLRSLLDAVLKDTAIPRIRLGSLEPGTFQTVLWSCGTIHACAPFASPLQSGSNTFCGEWFEDVGRKLRKFSIVGACTKSPFQITSDLIVGFPGETVEEFKETRDS